MTITLNEDERHVVIEALRLFVEICRINAQAAGNDDTTYVRVQKSLSHTARQVAARIKDGTP